MSENLLGLIDDGDPAMVYHPDGKRQPITIQTSVGICVIMPVYIEDDHDVEVKRIIDVKL